jgi:hypothetical protein
VTLFPLILAYSTFDICVLIHVHIPSFSISVMMYENEREYNGDWSEGRWHGYGTWVNPNGDRYEGSFVYDTRHGQGVYSWRNGNVYRGEFHEDKRQGKVSLQSHSYHALHLNSNF